MKCPKCKNKCQTVQTIHDTEVKIIDDTQQDANGEVKMCKRPIELPVVKRKHKCLTCGCYFYTKETFTSFTEQTIRNGIDLQSLQKKIDEAVEDAVYCTVPEQKVQIKLTMRRKGI